MFQTLTLAPHCCRKDVRELPTLLHWAASRSRSFKRLPFPSSPLFTMPVRRRLNNVLVSCRLTRLLTYRLVSLFKTSFALPLLPGELQLSQLGRSSLAGLELIRQSVLQVGSPSHHLPLLRLFLELTS